MQMRVAGATRVDCDLMPFECNGSISLAIPVAALFGSGNHQRAICVQTFVLGNLSTALEQDTIGHSQAVGDFYTCISRKDQVPTLHLFGVEERVEAQLLPLFL